MRKAFVTVLPDEPYKVTTNKNIQVPCFYTGSRYLLVRMNDDDTVFCVERRAETLEEIENLKIPAEHLAEEKHWQIVLDAEINTWEAAYLSHDYEHDVVEDYAEVLSTGETWEYHYSDYTGALAQPFYNNDLKYDRATKTWIRPRYRTHALTRNQFMDSVVSQTQTYKEALDSGAYPAPKLEEIRIHYEFLKAIPTKYANIDHWKIGYPNPPSI